jgi:hypothetical protein
MRSPCRDNPNRFAPLRERDEVNPAIYLANRLAAVLAIVAPSVQAFQAARVGEYPRRMGEIETALQEGAIAFRLIPFEYHMGGIAV